jgi:hypothetical protein
MDCPALILHWYIHKRFTGRQLLVARETDQHIFDKRVGLSLRYTHTNPDSNGTK